MIYIYYWAGNFGSTVEYVLRSFTNEYTPVNVEISSDGSMHGFSKHNHLMNSQVIEDFYNSEHRDSDRIVTQLYPTADEIPLNELISKYMPRRLPTDKFVLLYANNESHAELNRLFQYHKIFNGAIINAKLTPDISFQMFGNFKSSISRWNPAYTEIGDMSTWEIREWQSLSDYQEMLNAPGQVDSTFLKISTEEILNDTVNTFEKIINWCGLTKSSANLLEFATQWQAKQQYVLDEYKLIVDIVDATINNIPKPIPNDLNIFAQAIIQRRLRKAGYEIRCDGLNDLPNNTTMLHSLLEKVS